MKAVTYHRYGSPDVLGVEELAKPEPKDHEVRILVQAAAVTSADCAFRRGEPFATRLFNGLRGPRDPVLGTEFSGRIEAVGRSVTRFSVGDEVVGSCGTSFGAHAEYLCMAQDGALGLRPTNVGPDEATSVNEGALTALPFLRDEGHLARGQRVLINGASGAIGTSAVQLAKIMGAHVTGVCSTANLELVRSLGADDVIDYTQQDFTEAGETYDVVFDTVGRSSFSRSRAVLRPGGIYLNPVLSLGILWQSLWTAHFGSRRAKIAFAGLRKPAEKSQDLALIKQWVEAGDLRAVIDGRYRFDQAAAAHRRVETGHKRGNLILAA